MLYMGGLVGRVPREDRAALQILLGVLALAAMFCLATILSA
jgi:hypothetical protein